MKRLVFFLTSAPLVWCQAEGRYHYAAISVKSGVTFQAAVRSGSVSIARQTAPRFTFDDPSAPGRALSLAASQSGAILAGATPAGAPGLFVALRAPQPGQSVALAPGEWSAAMISFDGRRARGLRTAFLDFTIEFNGAFANAAMVSHEAAVDDVSRAEPVELKLVDPGSLEINSWKHVVAIAAQGDMFLATSSAPAHSSFVIAVRRERDASTMAMRGAYALAEIGARNSFAFAPDQARFYSTVGTFLANLGQGRLSQHIALGDSVTQFAGSAAYMVSSGGAGIFSPRFEQRRRNLAVAGGGGIFITAQVAEAGQLLLLHGVGVGLLVRETTPPALASRATAQGNIVSLYGRELDDLQVLIGGQPAEIVQAWPNQINVKLAAASPASTLSVELEGPWGRTAPSTITIGAALPEFASAPAVPGGMIAPAQPGSPGDTIQLGITGAVPLAGSRVLFDGLPGTVVSSSLVGGATQLRVMLPRNLTPAQQVNVAIAAPGYYIDLGDIAVSRPRPAAGTPATH